MDPLISRLGSCLRPRGPCRAPPCHDKVLTKEKLKGKYKGKKGKEKKGKEKEKNKGKQGNEGRGKEKGIKRKEERKI